MLLLKYNLVFIYKILIKLSFHINVGNAQIPQILTSRNDWGCGKRQLHN